MADVHDKKTRSYNMSKIKGKNTKPEMLVRKFLHSKGFRYKLHEKKLPGKPDIVLPKYKTIIMVHGCFWHGHEGCKYFKIPKTRTEWWTEKIQRTQLKDKENEKLFDKSGWKVITVYECDLKAKKINSTLENLVKEITNGSC